MKQSINISPEAAYKQKKSKLAARGLIIAWVSSLTCVLQGNFNTIGTGHVEAGIQSTAFKTIIIAISLLALVDFIAGIFSLIANIANGRGITEYKRLGKVKVSWIMLLAAFAAGPFATGCWMASANFCGITYTLVIMSITPIVVAIVGRIVFKEVLGVRVVIGICIVVAGVLVTSYVPPEGAPNFYLGIALAAMAPIGFTAEGMLGTYASDLIDPITGCGLYRCLGSGILGFIVITILGCVLGDVAFPWMVIKTVLTNGNILIWILLAALMAAISYNTTYIAYNACGPTRALAIVNTTSIWSIPIGFAFAAIGILDYSVTTIGIIGALIVLVGITLVVAKPSELVNLRDV